LLAGCVTLGGCGDRGGDAAPLSVVTFNVLHGLIDEDPTAGPFDRFPERLPLIAGELARRQYPAVGAAGQDRDHRGLIAEF
jgi:hypothetical protein